MAKNQKQTDSLLALFPGREIVVEGIKVTVYPIKTKQFRTFSQQIMSAWPKLAFMLDVITRPELANDSKFQQRAIETLVPLAMTDLFDLVNDCCDVDLDELAHHILPPIIDAWVEENFGDPKLLMPWADLLRKLMARLPGEKKTTRPTGASPESSATSSPTATTNGT